MPSNICDHGATMFMASVFGLGAAPASFWIALCSPEPGTDSDGTVLADLEPAGGGYARILYAVGADNWSTDGGYLSNAKDIDFGTATADWGFLDHFVLCTDQVDGELYAFGELTDAQYIEADTQVILPAGSIVLALVPLDDTIAI